MHAGRGGVSTGTRFGTSITDTRAFLEVERQSTVVVWRRRPHGQDSAVPTHPHWRTASWGCGMYLWEVLVKHLFPRAPCNRRVDSVDSSQDAGFTRFTRIRNVVADIQLSRREFMQIQFFQQFDCRALFSTPRLLERYDDRGVACLTSPPLGMSSSMQDKFGRSVRNSILPPSSRKPRGSRLFARWPKPALTAEKQADA